RLPGPAYRPRLGRQSEPRGQPIVDNDRAGRTRDVHVAQPVTGRSAPGSRSAVPSGDPGPTAIPGGARTCSGRAPAAAHSGRRVSYSYDREMRDTVTEYMTETIFTWGAPPLKFGVGAVDELGHECARLDWGRGVVVPDT